MMQVYLHHYNTLLSQDSKIRLQKNAQEILRIDVELAGFEPASRQAINKLSTCLVLVDCRHSGCVTRAT